MCRRTATELSGISRNSLSDKGRDVLAGILFLGHAHNIHRQSETDLQRLHTLPALRRIEMRVQLGGLRADMLLGHDMATKAHGCARGAEKQGCDLVLPRQKERPPTKDGLAYTVMVSGYRRFRHVTAKPPRPRRSRLAGSGMPKVILVSVGMRSQFPVPPTMGDVTVPWWAAVRLYTSPS